MKEPKPMRNVLATRPNPRSRWQCGYQSLGLACTEGPDERGVCCQLRREKAPSCETENKECDQNCGCAENCELAKLRRNPQLPSHEELGPCVPQRTAWYARQTLALNMAILVGGVLLLCMALPQREAVFVPGGLSRKHSQILGNHLVSQRCSLCHPNSHSESQSLSQPLDSQDALCMQCHQSHMPEARLRSPHDLSPMQLVSLKKIDSTDARNIGELEGGAKTSCASCHIEHRGETFDLTAMSDARCQACHAQQFQSLAQGHPQFDNYPYRSQRRIAFDHRAHHDKHFGTKGESFDCTSCHVDKTRTGQVGSVFRSVDFAQACARCHEQAIASETINGWALLQVPSIEAADSHDSSLGLTDWPTTAMFGYEAEFSIPLRILLAADPDAYDSLRKLPASGRLEDILLHSGDRAEVSRALALAFRRLVKDVAVSGQVAWKERLVVVAERALQRQLNPLELSLIAELSSGLPPDLFRHIETAWFGKQSTLADSSVEKPPFRMVVQSAQDDLLLSAEDDGLLDNSLSQSDLVEDGLLEQNSIASESPASGASATILTQLRGATHVAAGGWYLDPELLALCYMPQGHADRTLAAWEEYICLIQSGHAQTAPGDMPGDLPDDLPGELDWQRLTHGQSLPGSCTQCHLLEAGAEPAAGQSVWQSLARPESVRPFTRFDHTPHLTLPALSDCRYCHRFDSGSPQTLATAWEDPLGPGGDDSAGAYHSLNRLTREHLSHEFESMQRSQCVACHRPGGASDGCTQCHHYHVGNPGFDWSQN